jgi:hypothetical protein
MALCARRSARSRRRFSMRRAVTIGAKRARAHIFL